MKNKLVIIFLALLFSGCKTTESPFIKRSTLETKITELGVEKEKAIKDAVQNVIQTKNAEIQSVRINFQNSADWIYGTRIALDLFEPKARLWDVTSNRLDTAASYAPPPSREALIEQMKTLKEELDETRVSNDELNNRYNKAREDAAIAVQIQEKKTVEAQNAVQKLTETELEWEKRVNAVQSELIDVQKLIQANSDEKKAQDEWRRKQIRWIMGVTGVLSLVALAGTIFIPVMKKELGTLAGILGATTILLPFVTPLYAAIALGTVFAGVLGIVSYKFLLSDKANKAVIRAVQEHKEEDPEGFKTTLAPKLENWTGKYDKDGNVVEDKTLKNYIDKVLIETESK
jgi:hypothetical protein